MDKSMIRRDRLIKLVEAGLAEMPIVALIGARQVGKTTLARQVADAWKEETRCFDMERESDRAALSAPERVLSAARGLVVIDEAQRTPKLFEVLRPLADRVDLPARFLLLGSASLDMIKGVSESLAGRIRFIPVSGLTLDELSVADQNDLWLRGGFPRAFLAKSPKSSLEWRRDFIRTYLERDIPALGLRVASDALRRFWSMLAHYHGQIWNSEELGRSLGVTGKTARSYLDILSGTYLTRVLPPWFENAGKRIVKSPKIYFRDSGLLHAFLGIETDRGLWENPKYGASWEGFAMEQILARTNAFQPYFWATQQGAELDLLLERDGRRVGVEFKCADAPTMTKSMRVAMEDLKLERLFVVYPGARAYPLRDRVDVLPLSDALRRLTTD